jgi:PAC2 family
MSESHASAVLSPTVFCNVQAVPAIGNTGQLAVDLLAVHLRAQQIAVLESVNVLPVAGDDALAAAPAEVSGKLCSALEVYQAQHAGGAMTLLQQRGPVATGCSAAFAKELAEWIQGAGFAEVLLVSSVDAAERRDREIQGPQLAVVSAPEQSGRGALEEALDAAGVPRWEQGSDERDAAAEPAWKTRRAGPWCATPALQLCHGTALCLGKLSPGGVHQLIGRPVRLIACRIPSAKLHILRGM